MDLILKSNSNVNVVRKWTFLILIWLPLSTFIGDLIIIPVGPIFLNPVKLTMLFGFLYMVRYISSLFISSYGNGSTVLRLFYLYVAMLTCSLFYSEAISFSQKINYTFLNVATIIIVHGLNRNLTLYGYTYFIEKLSKTLIIIFYLSLSLSFLQLISGDPIIRNIGIIPSKPPYNIFGFNFERLYLCEFLVIGISLIILQKKHHFIFRYLLITVTVTIIIATDSYSGRLCLIALLFLIKDLNFKKIFLACAFGIIFYSSINSLIEEYFLSRSEIIIRDQRKAQYFENFQQLNWRVVASIFLLNDFIENPTYFGRGLKANDKKLLPVLMKYKFLKTGKWPKERNFTSSHTFISIFYDQGIIGMTIFTLMITYLLISILKLIRYNKYDQNEDLWYLSRLAIVFSWTVLIRFLFYYHTNNYWHFLLAFLFLNITLNIFKRDRLELASTIRLEN